MPPGSVAGAIAETRHIASIVNDPAVLDAFQVLTLPGGFLVSATTWGRDESWRPRLGSVLGETSAAVPRPRRPGPGDLQRVPGPREGGALARPRRRPWDRATLTFNDSGHFESRWVRLIPTPGLSPFLADDEPIELPVAHGEGKFVVADPAALDHLEAAGQVVLRYADESGNPSASYPANPNGSVGALAGLCDPSGRIFGLMPHPERVRRVDPPPAMDPETAPLRPPGGWLADLPERRSSFRLILSRQ